jgi:hypothetical protein
MKCQVGKDKAEKIKEHTKENKDHKSGRKGSVI